MGILGKYLGQEWTGTSRQIHPVLTRGEGVSHVGVCLFAVGFPESLVVRALLLEQRNV